MKQLLIFSSGKLLKQYPKENQADKKLFFLPDQAFSSLTLLTF